MFCFFFIFSSFHWAYHALDKGNLVLIQSVFLVQQLRLSMDKRSLVWHRAVHQADAGVGSVAVEGGVSQGGV